MAELSILLPLVREKCQGMPNQQALDQLKKSYRNFCLESAFVQNTETVTRNSDGTVELYPPYEHYIHSIALVENINGQTLTKGKDYKVNTSNIVTLAEGVDQAVITYSIVPELPMDNSVEANDEVIRRWPDEIAAGCAYLLRMMPNKPWTDQALSDFYKRDFVKGHREAFRMRVVANDESQFQTQTNRDFF